MSEWSKEAVLKTVEPKGSGGSNPPCSGKLDELEVLKYARVCGIRIPPAPDVMRSRVLFETIAQLDRASDCGSEGRWFEPT